MNKILNQKLTDNTKLAELDCVWCDAIKGKDAHSAGCPLGERYKQIQAMGGVSWKEQIKESENRLDHKISINRFFIGETDLPHFLDNGGVI